MVIRVSVVYSGDREADQELRLISAAQHCERGSHGISLSSKKSKYKCAGVGSTESISRSHHHQVEKS